MHMARLVRIITSIHPSINPWALRPLVSNVLSLPHYSEFLGYWAGSGIQGYRVDAHHLSFRLPNLGVLHSLFFTCYWISFVFLLYGRRICTHLVNPSLTHFLGEFPGLGLTLEPDVVVPVTESLQ